MSEKEFFDIEFNEIREHVLPSSLGGNGFISTLALCGEKLVDLVFFESLIARDCLDDSYTMMRKKALVSKPLLASCGEILLVPNAIPESDFLSLPLADKSSVVLAVVGALYKKETYNLGEKTRNAITLILNTLQSTDVWSTLPTWIKIFPGERVLGKTSKEVLSNLFQTCGINETAYQYMTTEISSDEFLSSLVALNEDFMVSGVPVPIPGASDVYNSKEDAENDVASKVLHNYRIAAERAFNQAYLSNIAHEDQADDYVPVTSLDAQDSMQASKALTREKGEVVEQALTLENEVSPSTTHTHLGVSSTLLPNDNTYSIPRKAVHTPQISHSVTDDVYGSNYSTNPVRKSKSVLNEIYQRYGIANLFGSSFSVSQELSGYVCAFVPHPMVCDALGLSMDLSITSNPHVTKKEAEEELCSFILKLCDTYGSQSHDVSVRKRSRSDVVEPAVNVVPDVAPQVMPAEMPEITGKLIKTMKSQMYELFQKWGIHNHIKPCMHTGKVGSLFVTTFAPNDVILSTLKITGLESPLVGGARLTKKEAEEDTCRLVMDLVLHSEGKGSKPAEQSPMNSAKKPKNAPFISSSSPPPHFKVITASEKQDNSTIAREMATQYCSTIDSIESPGSAKSCLNQIFQRFALENIFSGCYSTDKVSAGFRTVFNIPSALRDVLATDLPPSIVGSFGFTRKDAEEDVSLTVLQTFAGSR